VDLSHWDDADLARATDRAYWRAARSYTEARAPLADVAEADVARVRAMLLDSADSDSRWWRLLRDEQARRRSAADAMRRAADAAAERAGRIRPHYALMPGGGWEDGR